MLWQNVAKIAVAVVMATTFTAATGCGDDGSSPVPWPDGGPRDGGPDSTSPDAGPDAEPPQEVVATPEFQPGEGTFEAPQNVIIVTATAGATIHYTLDGTTPDATSPVYSAPLTIAKTMTVKAIARKAEFRNSQVRTGTYVVNIPPGIVEPVQIEPNAGKYANDVPVVLTSATPGATVCYTLDDSAPACSKEARCTSGAATDGSPVSITKTGTPVRAMACKSGMIDSAETRAAYTLTADKPTFDPSPGSYEPAHPVPVTLATTTKGGVIHYTTDGTTPDCSSPLTFTETGTIPAFKADTTVSALTCKGNYATSDVVTMKYLGENCVGSFDIRSHAELEALSRCKEITGSLYIRTKDVSNLAPLGQLARVSDDLDVSTETNALQSLHGLEALTHVGGRLRLDYNPGLTNLDGLGALQSVGGGLIVSNNAITHWTGPETLTSVGYFYLSEPKLQVVAGFRSLAEIRGGLTVSNNAVLTQFASMPALTTIAGGVNFTYNLALESVSGFAKVREIGGNFLLGHSYKLARFRAFPNLTTVRGAMFLAEMRNLSELGFGSLETIQGTLWLHHDLPALKSLHGFRNLIRVGYLSLYGELGFPNMKGLEHLTTIDHRLSIEKTQGLTDLTGLENLTAAGSIKVSETTLRNLHGLDKLTSLTEPNPGGYSIEIERNDAMTEIGSLDALTQIAGGIDLYDNWNLAQLNGLRALKSVFTLSLGWNAAMTKLNGLSSLEHVRKDLWLSRNLRLESLDELGALTKVDGSVVLYRNFHIKNLSGLRSLASVGGELHINGCEDITHLSGLEALQSIGSHLTIADNRALIHLDALSGLAQLGGNFTVADNATLPTCQPTKVVERLQASGYAGVIDIRDNGGTGTCN